MLLEDGGARITGYDGEDAELTVPDELDGHPVREIGERAFYWCDALANVTLPDGLTSIGDYAFYWCNALTSVTLPDGLTSIGANPFRGCDSPAKIDVGRLSSKYNSLEEDIERRTPAKTLAWPAVDQIKDALKLRL